MFVLPSVDEAFGVAYVEAMAGAVPAIGCRGEAGPEEIAAAGGGMRLVPPADPEALARGAADAARRAGLAQGARRRRARHRRAARSPGSSAGARRSPPTRTRSGERPAAGPLRHQPRPGLPHRGVPGPARARGRRVRARRRRAAPRRGARAVPGAQAAAARRRAARRVGPLPRRRRGALRARRAPGRLPGRAPGARAVRALGDDLAPSAHARPRALLPARCATCTGTRTRSPPTGRT